MNTAPSAVENTAEDKGQGERTQPEATNEVVVDEVTAQSSSAEDQGAKAPVTLEDVVRQHVTSPSDTVESEPPTDEGKQESQAELDGESEAGVKPVDAAKTETKPEELPPFHSHPRWKEQLRVNKEQAAQIATANAQLETYKVGADQYEKIVSFCETNQLAPDEVANGFQIMALMRSNPERAYELITPLVQSLELVTGRKLPDEIRAKVDDGLVDESVAKDLAKANLRAQQAEQRVAVNDRQRAEAYEQQTMVAIQNTVTATEQAIASRDPDYSRKQPFIMDRVRVLIAERNPRTPDACKEILETAHREISERMKPLVTERRPVTSVSSGNSSTNAKPAPKTLEEVVRGALA
jgi:hypothetical protein